MNTQTIKLSKTETEKLHNIAQSYGLSTDEMVRRIIAEITRSLIKIPEESLDDYDNKEQILQDFYDAIIAQKKGKLLTALPKK